MQAVVEFIPVLLAPTFAPDFVVGVKEGGTGFEVLACFCGGFVEADDQVIVISHHAVGDELAVVSLGEMVEELDEFISLRGIGREGIVVGFGASYFAENVVEGVSGFDFGAAISGHFE